MNKRNNFRTIVEIKPSEEKLSLQSKILTIGSCFSDTIGNQLINHKFAAVSNPLGTIFNPISIFKSLNFLLGKQQINENGYLQNNDIHFHYDFHSSFSALSKSALEIQINTRIEEHKKQLKNCNFIFITLGTALVYEHKELGEVVGNCHKVAAKRFSKRLLKVEEIITNFENVYANFSENTQFIFTVSPVRHLKETLEANSVSKSVLRLACDALAEKYGNVNYFAAYELLLDELRDYRFYSDDMLHPSNLAIQYIWERFQETFFNTDTIAFVEAWVKIRKDLNHRALQPKSAAHQQFLKSVERKLKAIALHENISVSEEIAFLEKQQK